jgi:DDE family transposase
LADTGLTYHHERDEVRLIRIDPDVTDHPTYGQQEFALFNGYYDTWCYLPFIATVTFNAEPIKHVVAALRRPGTGAATRGVRGPLRRLLRKLHAVFPWARLRVRADAGFAEAKLLAFLDAAGVECVLGLTGNRRPAAGPGADAGWGHRGRRRRCMARRGMPPGAGAASGASLEGRGALLSRPVRARTIRSF